MPTLFVLTELFLLQIALGIIVFSPLANFRETGMGFLKLLGGVCLGLLAFLLLLFEENPVNHFMTHHLQLKDLFFFASSALLSGIVIYSMLLGHWYLVTPRLSTRPLVLAHYILWFLLFIKMGYASIELFNQGNSLMGEGYSFYVLLFLMRILWGYLVLGIMSLYSFRLVRIRSLQSATGMFYAMTFFVLVGELISGYLYLHRGILL